MAELGNGRVGGRGDIKLLLNALNQKAFKPWVVLAGFGIGSGAFGVLSLFGAPVLLVYGAVRGLNQTLPHSMLLMCSTSGACWNTKPRL